MTTKTKVRVPAYVETADGNFVHVKSIKPEDRKAYLRGEVDNLHDALERAALLANAWDMLPELERMIAKAIAKAVAE